MEGACVRKGGSLAMCPELPSFLLRRKLLFEARRLLLDGAPDAAFDCLQDPVLSLSVEADSLRERVMKILCREAARLADEGQDRRAAGYLERVAGVDPELARRWRARVMASTTTVVEEGARTDRKSTRLNSSHVVISYAVFCLKKKKT